MRPSPDRNRRSRVVAALVAVLALTAGCAQQDPPGVGVQKLAVDIVFGVKPPAPDAPPPNLAPGAADGEAVTYVPPALPSLKSLRAPGAPAFNTRPPRLPAGRLRPTPLTPARSTCPPATLNAFPATEAGFNVVGLPAEGQYRWKRQGTQTVATLPGVKLPIAGFEQRLVRNVIKLSDTEFTFETVQPELAGGITTVSTFKVKTAATSRTVSPPVTPPDQLPSPPETPVPVPVTPPTTPPGVEVPSVPPSITAGEPERGVSLMKLQRFDAEGNSSELTFSPGVLYLPLQVVPGEQFTSVGIDPRTGAVLQHQAQVVRRERVDACGEIIDGWLVEATQTFSGSAGTAPPRTYRYIVAPQLGGILTSEELHTTSAQGTTDVVISLGQLRPSPLPGQQQAPSGQPAQPGQPAPPGQLALPAPPAPPGLGQ